MLVPDSCVPARKNTILLRVALKHGMGDMPLYNLLVAQRVHGTYGLSFIARSHCTISC